MERRFEILDARQAANLTQRDVEKYLNYPSGTLIGFERGRVAIAEVEYERIMAALPAIAARKKEAKRCADERTRLTSVSG